ncbi:hypothetical protein SUDANB105_08147 (plasmid) [Streptomyces sp. enrichment culture]
MQRLIVRIRVFMIAVVAWLWVAVTWSRNLAELLLLRLPARPPARPLRRDRNRHLPLRRAEVSATTE